MYIYIYICTYIYIYLYIYYIYIYNRFYGGEDFTKYSSGVVYTYLLILKSKLSFLFVYSLFV